MFHNIITYALSNGNKQWKQNTSDKNAWKQRRMTLIANAQYFYNSTIRSHKYHFLTQHKRHMHN